MLTFDQALAAEPLIQNKDGVHSVASNHFLSGPTPVDLTFDQFDKPRGFAPSAPQSQRERAMLAGWKKRDLAQFYREQRGNRRR